jgi:hypothetical protein
MFLQHVHATSNRFMKNVNAAFYAACSISMEMKYAYAACTCSMNLDTQHGLGHATWTWTSSMNIHHRHGLRLQYSWTGALGCNAMRKFLLVHISTSY